MKYRAKQKLSSIEISALELGHKEGDQARYRNRCQAVLLFHVQGKRMQELIDIYKIGRDTISRWLNRYEAEGVEGLKDRKKTGRPIKREKELLKKI